MTAEVTAPNEARPVCLVCFCSLVFSRAFAIWKPLDNLDRWLLAGELALGKVPGEEVWLVAKPQSMWLSSCSETSCGLRYSPHTADCDWCCRAASSCVPSWEEVKGGFSEKKSS